MERINWLSNVRVFALVSMVLLHIAAGLLYNFSTSPSFYWWIGNVYDGMVRCCVPLFVMITGALLLSKEIDLKRFFQKRFMRIVIPFIFWSFVYVLNRVFWKEETNFLTDLWNSNFWERLVKGDISFHLWYVYMLIGLLFFVPILNKWIRHCTEKEIVYFLCMWLISLILSHTFIHKDLKLVYFSGYVGYLVLGYYLAHAEKYRISNLRLKTGGKLLISNKLILGIIIVIAFSTTILGTYFNSVRMNKFDSLFYEYLMPNVLLAAIGIFLLIKSCTLKNKIVLKIIHFLDRYSYGIYLIHILVLTYLWKFLGINAYFIHPSIGIVITTILCVGVSAGIIYAVHKIPFIGKHISG